jgi:hypothetical protein
VADKGFDMEKEMSTGNGLNIPPFLNGTPQLLLKIKHYRSSSTVMWKEQSNELKALESSKMFFH